MRPPSEERGAASWYESTARQRIDLLLDAESFVEVLPPTERAMSPHLAIFDLPAQFDDGIAVGRGRLAGRAVLVAAQEGRFMGGAFGEVHGAKLVGLLRAARELQTLPVLILFDTGGVRLQEANAGELAIAEIMRAIVEARSAGVAIIGLVGGRAGCFGGGGLIAGCCSALAVSEQGRIGVTGPEVIETNRGIEEFDSKDRALVWRTVGGRHRRLLGGADAYAADTVAGFRSAALDLLERVPAFDLEVMRNEQRRLQARLDRFGGAQDARDIWAALGVNDPAGVSALPDEDFQALADRIAEPAHDAR